MKDWLNDTTYKGVVIEGSHFPGEAYNYDVPIVLNKYIVKEYIPTVKKLYPNITKGMFCVMLNHTHMEGFKPGSRSYSTRNPGNIGNTDGGGNKVFTTLEEGVKDQYEMLLKIAAGEIAGYKVGRKVNFKSYYSKEIARNTKTYQKSPWVPGYRYTYTGQLDQYFKIYATAPRSGNKYINSQLSICKIHGLYITPESKIQDIILMN